MAEAGQAGKRKRTSTSTPMTPAAAPATTRSYSLPETPALPPSSLGPPLQRPGYRPPGRLGNPRMELAQEPRLDPGLLRILHQYGLDRHRRPPSLATLSPTSTMEELEASMAQAEFGFETLYEELPNDLASDRYELEVTQRTEVITGRSGNQIKLFIYRPVVRGGPLPCVIYAHGGSGIAITKTDNKVHRRWCTSLATAGMIVISVEYRNSRSAEAGFAHFPAALEDISAAVQYVYNHRTALDTRNIVLQGDGGGGNLMLAVAIKAKREGWVTRIDGVYACSPYISNAYSWIEARKLQELPSLVECQGYLMDVDYIAYMAHLYTPRSADSSNPLAWPYHASKEDLEGLPPHVLSMDELSPLRSEGEAYVRKLSQAGVRVVGHVTVGAVHTACLVFRQAVPEMHRECIRSIAAFARQV